MRDLTPEGRETLRRLREDLRGIGKRIPRVPRGLTPEELSRMEHEEGGVEKVLEERLGRALARRVVADEARDAIRIIRGCGHPGCGPRGILRADQLVEQDPPA